jgi:hypothetical protein
MLNQNLRTQWLIGLFLVLLMVVTRSHQISLQYHFYDASSAIFFLAGVYLAPRRAFAAACALAAAIDWTAIHVGGISDICITPAYAMLLPAYASLWAAGRWYRQHHRDTLTTLVPLFASAATASFIAELFSSGGFYFLGGQFADVTLAGFIPRLVEYFPSMLEAMLMYVGMAAITHATIYFAHGRNPEPHKTAR